VGSFFVAYSDELFLKTNPGKKCREEVKRRSCVKIPSPSRVGKNGDCQTGSSPGSGSSFAQTFPRFSSQWHAMSSLPITVAGPRRHYTGLPY